MILKPNSHNVIPVDSSTQFMQVRHLNQQELSNRLGISCRTLERWRWTGVGPRFIKIEGRVKYRLADIEPMSRNGFVNQLRTALLQ
jgi:predicted site-specific integrase-resolvase